MLDWLNAYRSLLEKCNVKFFPSASIQEIQSLEKQLNIQLPPSYKAFLRISNGLEEYHLYGSIFSTTQVLEAARKWSFTPWNGQLEVVDPNNKFGHYYSYRPKHFLLFSSFYPGGDGYCLNTKANGEEEHTIHHYDIEFVELNQLDEYVSQPHYASFEQILIQPLLEVYMTGVKNGRIAADLEVRKAFEKISGQSIDAQIHKLKMNNPKSFKRWYRLGKSYFQLEEYELALVCFEHALEIKPENQEIKKHREQLLKLLG